MLIRDLVPASGGDLAVDLLLLQRAAYACEAALIGDDRIPALHEGLDELVRAPLSWVGAFTEEGHVGALGYQDATDHLDIDRLVVSPRAHRRGTGSALVREALHRAGPRHVTMATGRDNHPARALYERLDFLDRGRRGGPPRPLDHTARTHRALTAPALPPGKRSPPSTSLRRANWLVGHL